MPTVVVGMTWRGTCLLSRCARLASMAPVSHHQADALQEFPISLWGRVGLVLRRGRRRGVAIDSSGSNDLAGLSSAGGEIGEVLPAGKADFARWKAVRLCWL